ncbi:CRISPR-associated endonuclease Cas2 [Azoarcus sp. PA01]|nr:CRISPR-associated endonuclease Cas2 [Azoarcus sp. PA01]KON82493.1 CRISPR-associated endonuclease Cas2 [Azoarcus sp. PA01]
MTERSLFLAAYDVASPRRLATALARVRAYRTGGQKSVHEIFLTPAERHELLRDMSRLLEASEDRFLLLRLDPRARVWSLGLAQAPADDNYFYVG